MRILFIMLFLASCASTPIPSWRDAYKHRKPVAVTPEGVTLYGEHIEYIKRELNYMCLAGIKQTLPKELTNKQALDFCGCMLERFYTKQELEDGLISIDYNPNEYVRQMKKTQDEIWAVLDDQFRNDYREIAKYPPGYFEKVTEDRANCIDDINYKVYNSK